MREKQLFFADGRERENKSPVGKYNIYWSWFVCVKYLICRWEEKNRSRSVVQILGIERQKYWSPTYLLPRTTRWISSPSHPLQHEIWCNIQAQHHSAGTVGVRSSNPSKSPPVSLLPRVFIKGLASIELGVRARYCRLTWMDEDGMRSRRGQGGREEGREKRGEGVN